MLLRAPAEQQLDMLRKLQRLESANAGAAVGGDGDENADEDGDSCDEERTQRLNIVRRRGAQAPTMNGLPEDRVGRLDDRGGLLPVRLREELVVEEEASTR